MPIDKLIEDIADKQTDCITNKKEKE